MSLFCQSTSRTLATLLLGNVHLWETMTMVKYLLPSQKNLRCKFFSLFYKYYPLFHIMIRILIKKKNSNQPCLILNLYNSNTICNVCSCIEKLFSRSSCYSGIKYNIYIQTSHLEKKPAKLFCLSPILSNNPKSLWLVVKECLCWSLVSWCGAVRLWCDMFNDKFVHIS